MTQIIAFVVYPGFSLLNLAGPTSVFEAANFELKMRGQKPLYAMEVASPSGGLVASDCGVALQTRAINRLPAARVHTALFMGAHMEPLLALKLPASVRRWAMRCAASATRFGAVCTGAFVIASLGLLDGKRAATHWFACPMLAEKYPSIRVDADSLYVVDGKTWTSAGASAGIDMALAMVSHDLGKAMASEVAKGLVVYARRPGYQSQFSPLLLAQAKAESPFSELIAWLQANLHRALDVPRLAARAGLSQRSFHRKFVAATGKTPAQFIETIRVDAARLLLLQGLSLKVIAGQVGLSPPVRLTAAFERRFGVTPNLFRQMHKQEGSAGRH